MKNKMNFLVMFFALLFATTAIAQTKNVTGNVTDENGDAAIAATVKVTGTEIGTVTDINGDFNLSVPANAETLTISYIGKDPQVVAISNNMVISLSRSDNALEGVIVTAFGIERDQESLGYAVSQVEGEALQQVAEPDFLRALNGKTPGVEIKGSGGQPGSATRITIRGATSFGGNNEPLYVVDGVPYDNTLLTSGNFSTGAGAYGSPISNIDPNDIKSLSVLRGAAASALYGARATNGVILITTKSGARSSSEQPLQVSVTTNFAVEEISGLPDYQNLYGNGANFRYSNSNGSWGPAFSSMDTFPTWGEYLNAFPELGPELPYVAQPDNVKNLFDTGFSYEGGFNISQSSEKSSFNITASRLDQDGYIPNSEFARSSISAGGRLGSYDGFSANVKLQYSSTDQLGGIYGNNQFGGSATSFARTLWLGRTWDSSLPFTNPVTGGPINWNGSSQYDHPLWSWENNTSTSITDRTNSLIGFGYKLNDKIRADYTLGRNFYNQSRKEITEIGSRGSDGTGSIIEDNFANEELNSLFVFKFSDKYFGDKLDVNFDVGNEVNQLKWSRNAVVGNTFISPNIHDASNTQQQILTDDEFVRRGWGLFGNLSLGYNNLFYLNLTGRNDWSSTLPEADNNFFYPSVSGSFVLSEALNLPSDFFGKVRGGWGRVGSSLTPYSLALTYPVGSVPILGQPNQSIPGQAPDPNLIPQQTEEWEVGTEWTLFGGKYGFEFSYYDRDSFNQQGAASTPISSGFNSLFTNFGNLNNKGIEVGLDLNPLPNDWKVKWNSYTTFTKNTSEVTELTDGVDRLIVGGQSGGPFTVAEVGQPYGVIRGTVNVRDANESLLINPSTGLLILAPDDQTIGDPNPDFLMSFNNTLRYKNFNLRTLFNYRNGGDLFSTSLVSMLGRGVTRDTEDRLKTWVIDGVYGDTNTLEPILDGQGNTISNTTQVTTNDLYFGNSFAINAADEWAIYDATTIRLSEVALGYSLTGKAFENTVLKGADITFVGRNLWYNAPNVPKYSNFDPEINGFANTNTQGIELTNAPNSRRIALNLNLKF